MSDFQYQGSELDTFALAVNWKKYWAKVTRPYISGDVLDVGCGTGNNIGILFESPGVKSWTALDPDPKLVERAGDRFNEKLGDRLTSEAGTAAAFHERSPDARFDTIIYIDVLEHIADDKQELATSLKMLRPGGKLVVLSPAIPFLFSPFDEAVGHYRRYTRKSLKEAAPVKLDLIRLRYMDVTGCALSMANKMLLQTKEPTQKQILFWDRVIIPVSRVFDPMLSWAFGRSVVGVWEREGDSH